MQWFEARATRSDLASLGALVVLLCLVAGAHLAMLRGGPERPVYVGDERYYLAWARKWADWGEDSLVPGRLGLHHRPPLALNVFAQLARPDEDGRFLYEKSRAILFRRIRIFHLSLLLLTLGCLYAQGRLLGLGPAGSLVAPGLLAVFPWFGFYVHGAWADPLRTALLSLAFVFLLAFLRTLRAGFLVPAGLVYGFAVLARSSYMQFLLAVVPLVVATAWLGSRGAPARGRTLRSAAAGALLVGAVLAVVGPQLYANWNAGYGLRLATNTWRNVDFGLIGPAPSDDADPRRWREEAKDAYLGRRSRAPEAVRSRGRGPKHAFHAEALDYVARERASKARVLAFLHETPVPTLLRGQAEKLRVLLFEEPSMFEIAVAAERWGPERSAALGRLVGPARALWYAILALGLAGLVVAGWRSPGSILVSAFALYFCAGLLVAPLSSRFLIALAPILCLLAGAAATHGARAWPPARR